MDLFGRWSRLGGLAVAAVGFGITRLFLVEAVLARTTLSFLLAGLVPLLFGLGLTAYGVALTVGSFPENYVTAVARWCLAGTAAMLFVLVVTSVEPLLSTGRMVMPSGTSLLAANVLLAGAVGGTLTGIHSARAERQRRAAERGANRALLLDRLLRHEVINAAAIVRGNAELLAESERVDERAARTIERAADRITETIEEVGTLITDVDAETEADVARLLADAVEEARSAYPDVRFEVDAPTAGVDATVDDRVRTVFVELLGNAAEADGSTTVEVELHADPREVRIVVADDGSGLGERHRRLLNSGAFPEYDDPSAGFGLQIVRLLVLGYDGRVRTVDDDAEGARISVSLPRGAVSGGLESVGVSGRNLVWATLTGVLAGVVMGGFFVATTDVLPVIGSLYGVESPVIGMVTHLFHSVIFALMFAGGAVHPLFAGRLATPTRGGLAGAAWGTALWLVAAGVVMPLLLRGVGTMTTLPLPNLPPVGLASHVLWGAVLGVSYTLVRDRPLPLLD